MSDDHTKEAIVEIVGQKPGIKATELVLEVVSHLYISQKPLPESDIPEILNELVREGELVEVEYVLPSMSYRIKSLYFPKKTEVKLVSSHEMED